MTNGAEIVTSTFGQGNAGVIDIQADNISIDGVNNDGSISGIFSTVQQSAVGNAGNIDIITGELSLTDGAEVITSTFGQGNAGIIDIQADNISINGVGSNGINSGIYNTVGVNAIGNARDTNIRTNELFLANGGLISSSTLGQGNAGVIDIQADNISINGISSNEFFSGVYSSVGVDSIGNAGAVNITTNELFLTNNGVVNSSTFGQGDTGLIFVKANNLSLDNGAIFSVNNPSKLVEVSTNSTEVDNITLKIAENITLRNDSTISAQAGSNAIGGNINIDTNFIIAFPDGNNDILANADQGQGGIIDIDATSLFGIQQRELNSQTNDINASSNVDGLDGIINISTPDINAVQGTIELPTNVVVPEETTQQACETNRESAAKNSFTINGKGGILPDPALPLNSLNVTVNGENNPTTTISTPIETSQGKIQPARGIEVTESGEVILTAYQTNNSGDKPGGIAPQRLLKIKRNCG